MITRRKFLKLLYTVGSFLLLVRQRIFAFAQDTAEPSKIKTENAPPGNHLGVSSGGLSHVYGASEGNAEENMHKVIEMIGGIDKIIKPEDIVIIKPNAQWWNQGMTNTDSMKAFIESVFSMPGFAGEIIIAENHHKTGLNSRGWNTQNRNGNFNYNELIEYFNNRGFQNISKYHWQDAGYNPRPLQGDDGGGNRVNGPGDGEGYVWREDIQYVAPNGHVCWMTYPIFKSRYSGTVIDLKEGIWEKDRYLKEREIRFINFSALNHHGFYSGVTGSVKNLMGVVDMTCGLQAPQPEGTYNVHFVGVEPAIRFAWYTKRRWGLGFLKDRLRKMTYKHFEYTGGALGKFMNSIRMPDLNILTADWVGWGSRTDTSKSAHPRALLASRDPVALDYAGAKDVLFNSTPDDQSDYRRLNDPSIKNGPFYKFLLECHSQGIGNIDEDRITVEWFKFS